MRQAAALRSRGFDVDVVCLRRDGEPAREVHDGVRIRRLPVGRHRGRGMGIQLLEYLVFLLLATAVVSYRHLQRPYAVVQAHNLPDVLVFSAIVPRLRGAGVVLDVHDLMPEFFQARSGLSSNHPLVRLVRLEERLAVRFAAHTITVTEGWKRKLAERCGTESVSVVMNLADPATFSPRTGVGTREPFTIVYHGTLTRRYGVLLLVEAVAMLRQRVGPVRLRLLGDGDAREELVHLIAELDLDDCVELSEGMLGVDEVAAAIAEATVGVVPNLSNLFTDGLLPTKMLEYVAVGVPVVAARTPMIESYFDDDQVAFFEPGDATGLADALAKLQGDHELRAALASGAARFNETHTWPEEAARYVDLVESLAPRRS